MPKGFGPGPWCISVAGGDLKGGKGASQEDSDPGFTTGHVGETD
jgi:hypothetical protein